LNANGVQDAGEPGIAGVTLTLTGTDGAGNAVSATTTTTDANGLYQFTAAPGTYSVAVTNPAGYTPTATGKGTPATDSNVSPSGTTPVLLLGGGSDQTLDFGYYQLAGLGDFVWNDLNANGVQDAGEPGIAGVRVNLTGTDGAGNSVSATTITDASGLYQFTDLTPGQYQVQFVSPGGEYVLSPENASGSTAANDSDADTTTGKTVAITLISGQFDDTWDAGLIKLSSEIHGTISGHKFQDMTGNGLTSDDQPLGGTTINLFMDSNHDGQFTSADGPAIASAVTAAGTGEYGFTGLAPGVYFVQEVTPAWYVRTGPTLTDYFKADLTSAKEVSDLDFANFAKCCKCAVTNIYYTVNGGCAHYTDLRGNTNQGTLVQVTFTVLPGASATLTLVSYTAPQPYFDANTASQQNIFDQDSNLFGPGTYTLSVLVPNSYYQIDFICGLAIDHLGPAGSNIFYSAQNRLFSADNDGTTPPKSNPASLAGSVYYDADNDGIRQTAEQGIGLATVKLTGTDSQGHSVSMTRLTKPNGAYVFDNLSAGTYTITQSQAAGYIDGKDALGTLGGTLGNDVLSVIRLAAGAKGLGYNFGEIKASSLSGFVYKDSSNDGIKNSSERGISGVQIKLTGVDDLGRSVCLTATTDCTGAYCFSNLRAGTYKIAEVQPCGYRDGLDTLGSLGGTLGADQFSNILVSIGVSGANYNFGER